MTKRWHPTPPARLYVIFARETPRAVIFRRGPTKWTQLIEWHTDTDSFFDGQWFNGRIYERSCDLSPSGLFLIYFVNKFNWKTLKDPAYTSSWTAISRPPFLTALALWPKGDCWGGGGLFLSESEVWLDHPTSWSHPNHQPQGLKIIPNSEARGGVWSQRMTRDGWVRKQEGRYHSRWPDGWATEIKEVWERTQPHGTVTLRSVKDEVNFKRPDGHLESFYLIADDGDLQIPGAEWADWDQAGRLIFARAGQLWTGRWTGEALESELLADFNDRRPTNVVSPAWAKSWTREPE